VASRTGAGHDGGPRVAEGVGVRVGVPSGSVHSVVVHGAIAVVVDAIAALGGSRKHLGVVIVAVFVRGESICVRIVVLAAAFLDVRVGVVTVLEFAGVPHAGAVAVLIDAVARVGLTSMQK